MDILLPRARPNRVALVNIPHAEGESTMLPLGLGALAAYLRTKGIDVDPFDFAASRRTAAGLVAEYQLDSYPIVGISFYNSNAGKAYELATAIKRTNPRVLLVAGGPHASAADVAILRRHPEIDAIVRNEGELSFHELCAQFFADGELRREIEGVTHRKGHRLVRGGDRERVTDLDSLPAPHVQFTVDGTSPSMSFTDTAGGVARTKAACALVTSRSCPYNCSFCAIILIGRKWRAQSPERVVEQFLALRESQSPAPEHVYFLDANFFVSAERALAIARLLSMRAPGTTFSFATRVNQVIKHQHVFGELSEHGLRLVELGIESASAPALRRFAKDVTPDDNEHALSILRRHQLRLGLDFIMFDAEATPSDLRANLDFFSRNALDHYVPWDHYFSHLTPYLGTPIRAHYEALVGGPFDLDSLPDPASLIRDHSVRRVFERMRELEPLAPLLARRLDQLERPSARLAETQSEAARRKMNAITLRRFFHVAFENALERDGLEGAALYPELRRDDGERVDWAEFLKLRSEP